MTTNKGKFSFSELPLSDDYMFGQVMRQKQICILFLEALLEQEIADIEYINKQEDVTDGKKRHGIRLDVYLKDANNTVYNIEMQATNKDSLEKRARYYQSGIDRRTLKKNNQYKTMANGYVIFVCDYDYFKRGYAVYRRKSVIEVCPDVEYNDGSHVFILNSHYATGNASQAILEYLDCIKKNDVEGPYESELMKCVCPAIIDVRKDEEKEGEYMTLQSKLEEARADAEENAFLEFLRNMSNAGFTLHQMICATGREKEEVIRGLEIQGLPIPC